MACLLRDPAAQACSTQLLSILISILILVPLPHSMVPLNSGSALPWTPCMDFLGSHPSSVIS